MPYQLINVGTRPNASDGDPLRVALQKVNDNFRKLANVGPINGAALVLTAQTANLDSNLSMTWSASNSTSIISSTSRTNGNIQLSPRGIGRVILPSNAYVSIQGGLTGQFLATRGNGQLYWAYAGGANAAQQAAGGNYQVQYNINTQLSANAGLTFNPATQILSVPTASANLVQANSISVSGNVVATNLQGAALAVSDATVYGALVSISGQFNTSVNTANATITGTTVTGAVQTNNYLYANGAPVSFSGSSVAGGNTQLQFNNAGAFGAANNFTFNRATSTLSVPFIQATTVTASGGVNGTLIGTHYGAVYASTIQANAAITGVTAAFSGTVTANNFVSTGTQAGGGNLNITGATNLNLRATGAITANAQLRLASYAVGATPAGQAGAVIYISSTNRPAFYNGTGWRYFDGTAV